MKRILVIAMVALFGFAFGCGGAATPVEGAPEVPDAEVPAEEMAEEEAAADEGVTEEGTEEAPEEAPAE